jgi:hypothetical protein
MEGIAEIMSNTICRRRLGFIVLISQVGHMMKQRNEKGSGEYEMS